MSNSEISKRYDRSFFKQQENSDLSMIGLVECFKKHYHGDINSVIDLGCGIGKMLEAFTQVYKKNGNDKLFIRGVDGNYVQKDMIVIKQDEFISRNLEEPYTDSRKYDLAISTECAEHLEESRADGFVDDLVKLSDMVLFSAAVPYQGGTHHVNEQPLSYWVQKFEKRGYELRDIIRPDIWNDSSIATCYRQNMVIFVKKCTTSYELLDSKPDNVLIDVIHPDHWKYQRMLLEGRLGRIYMMIERQLIKLRAFMGVKGN